MSHPVMDVYWTKSSVICPREREMDTAAKKAGVK